MSIFAPKFKQRHDGTCFLKEMQEWNIPEHRPEMSMDEGDKCSGCPVQFHQNSARYSCSCGLTNLCRLCMDEHLRPLRAHKPKIRTGQRQAALKKGLQNA